MALVEKDPSLTIKIIGERFGVSSSVVSNVLKKAGIKHSSKTPYLTRDEMDQALRKMRESQETTDWGVYILRDLAKGCYLFLACNSCRRVVLTEHQTIAWYTSGLTRTNARIVRDRISVMRTSLVEEIIKDRRDILSG